MKSTLRSAALLSLFTLIGCGTSLAGTYTADVRLIQGKSESTEAGYSLDEVRTRVVGENCTLTLKGGRRFEWFTGDVLNEGTWRVEGDTLYLREDINDGRPIGAALQLDREWRIEENGDIIHAGSYSAYNLEVVYAPE